jgi:hypothetical protein
VLGVAVALGEIEMPADADVMHNRSLYSSVALPDVHWHRQIKACVGGVTAAVTGDPACSCRCRGAHQGPDGGGPVAAIVDLSAHRPLGRREVPPPVSGG